MRTCLVSLFAGVGGFDLGFARAGFTPVAHVEIDAACRRLLAEKWPEAVVIDDIRKAGAHNLPPCDVVTFGFPCQDLSVAGKRSGLKGERSGLFYDAMRVIEEIKPAWCLWENVPGLLSSDNGRDLARVLIRLGQSGYFGAMRVLDAQWLGVAQRRRRCFGLFTRLDSGVERCAEILSLAESLRGHPAPRREAGEGVAGGPGISVAGSMPSRASGGGGPGAGTDEAARGYLIPDEARPLMSEPRGSCTGQQTTLIPAVAGCLQERDAKGADSDTKPGHLVPVAAQVQWASGGGKVHNPAAQALRSGAEHNYQFAQVGMQVRRVTPTECERLQGFPDGWTAGFSDSQRYRMIGNAVAVPVAEWIARRLAAACREQGNHADMPKLR